MLVCGLRNGEDNNFQQPHLIIHKALAQSSFIINLNTVLVCNLLTITMQFNNGLKNLNSLQGFAPSCYKLVKAGLSQLLAITVPAK